MVRTFDIYWNGPGIIPMLDAGNMLYKAKLIRLHIKLRFIRFIRAEDLCNKAKVCLNLKNLLGI